jgi:hypothetical protein
MDHKRSTPRSASGLAIGSVIKVYLSETSGLLNLTVFAERQTFAVMVHMEVGRIHRAIDAADSMVVVYHLSQLAFVAYQLLTYMR